MFDAGFTEMLVVAIIALLVLGPERLPGAVRTVGLTVGRIKRGFADVRNQVEREIGADELRQQLHNERIMADLARQDRKTGSAGTATPPPASNVKRNSNPADTGSPQTTAMTAAPAPAEAANAAQAPLDDQPDKTDER